MSRGLQSAALIGMLAAAGALSSASCGPGYQYSSSGVITATVAFSAPEHALAITSAVPVAISGVVGQTQVVASLHATVSASTASTAKRLLKALTIGVTHQDSKPPYQLQIDAMAPNDAALGGLLSVAMPMGIDIAATVSSSITVDHAGGAIQIAAGGPVAIRAAPGSVKVATARGPVILDDAMAGSTQIALQVDQGDITLYVPQALSARIQAVVNTQGSIKVNLPGLPPYLGSIPLPYNTVVGGGGNIIQLSTNVGNIAINPRD